MSEGEGEGEEEGEAEAEGEPLPLPVAEGQAEAVALALALPPPPPPLLPEAQMEKVRVLRAETLGERRAVRVREREGVPEAQRVAWGDAEGLRLEVGVVEAQGVGLVEVLTVALTLMLRVPAPAVMETEAVGV